MGRRSINTTKSGKYMNPTDQARKEARKKELKKNKKQRMAVRHAVLKAKDALQLLEEAAMYDKQEYDPNVQAALNERVLQGKRKRLLDTFDNLLILYRKEDTEKAKELQKARNDYDKRRHHMMLYYEQVKLAERVKASEIPLPDIPNSQMGLIAAEIPLPIGFPTLPNKGILKKPFGLPGPPPGIAPIGRKPPGPPSGPVPDLSDSESEDDLPITRAQRKIRFSDVPPTNETRLGDSLSQGGFSSLQTAQIPLPPTQMTFPGFPGIIRPPDFPGVSSSQSRLIMQNPGGPVLSAPPTLNQQQQPKSEEHDVSYYAAASAAGIEPSAKKIEAKPQLKNLIGDATRFIPTALKVKRTVKDAHGRLQYVGGGVAHNHSSSNASAAKRIGSIPGGALGVSVKSSTGTSFNKATTNKDAAYDEFMREMEGLL